VATDTAINGPLTCHIVRVGNELALEIENISGLTLREIGASSIFLQRDEEQGERRAMIKFDPIDADLPPNARARLGHRTRFAKDLPNGTDDSWEDAPAENDMLILLTEKASHAHSYELDISFVVNGDQGNQTLMLGAGSGVNPE
jgi:hypothetical protein